MQILPEISFEIGLGHNVDITEGQGGSNLFLSSQTDKLMAATKFSDYLGLKHYKKAKSKNKNFIHLALAYWPQSFVTYRSI